MKLSLKVFSDLTWSTSFKPKLTSFDFFLRINEELFKNSNLTVDEVAKTMGIPRQHLSEILNVYLKSNFQDFVNRCRAKAFTEYVKDEKYANYTIMGIANEVGFKSKSVFNSTFKKLYGQTPSSYKKSLTSE